MRALFAAALVLLGLALYLDRPAPRRIGPEIWAWYCSGPCKEPPPPIPVATLRPEQPMLGPTILEQERQILSDLPPSGIRHAPQEPLMAITINGRRQIAVARGVLQRGDPPPGLSEPVVMTAQVWCAASDLECLRKLAHHWCSVEMPSSYRCRPGYDLARVLGADGP